jgi:hypothetical protein
MRKRYNNYKRGKRAEWRTGIFRNGVRGEREVTSVDAITHQTPSFACCTILPYFSSVIGF